MFLFSKLETFLRKAYLAFINILKSRKKLGIYLNGKYRLSQEIIRHSQSRVMSNVTVKEFCADSV